MLVSLHRYRVRFSIKTINVPRFPEAIPVTRETASREGWCSRTGVTAKHMTVAATPAILHRSLRW